MELPTFTTEEAELALRSLKTIATCDDTEPLSRFHRGALAAFQRHITRTELDVDALLCLSPRELAESIPADDALTRRVAVHDLCFMALADPDVVGEDRLELARRFAAALGVDAPIVEATAHAVRRQTTRLTLDALRMLAPMNGTLTERARSMWAAVAPFLGVTDGKVAARYRALGDLPAGTLGRAYFEFMSRRGLPFPGEKGGAPEGWFVAHDLTHILTGCSTERDGEVEIIGFQAGYTRSENPWEALLLAFVQAQLGIVLDPVAPARVGELDFDLLLRGYVRGTQARTDFGAGWDFAAELADDLEAVRARHGVQWEARPLNC